MSRLWEDFLFCFIYSTADKTIIEHENQLNDILSNANEISNSSPSVSKNILSSILFRQIIVCRIEEKKETDNRYLLIKERERKSKKHWKFYFEHSSILRKDSVKRLLRREKKSFERMLTDSILKKTRLIDFFSTRQTEFVYIYVWVLI